MVVANTIEQINSSKYFFMKRSLISAIFLLCGFISVFAQIKKAELTVNGLTCSMCNLATYKKLKTIDFIDSVSADLETTKYILHLNESKQLNILLIKSKVEDAGFSIGNLSFLVYFKKENINNENFWIIGNNSFKSIDNKVSNEGLYSLRIIEKGFLTDKEFKKFRSKINKSDSSKNNIFNVSIHKP